VSRVVVAESFNGVGTLLGALGQMMLV
jgi:hypothetical protein